MAMTTDDKKWYDISKSEATSYASAAFDLYAGLKANDMRFSGQLEEARGIMDQSTQAFINGEIAKLTAQNQSTAFREAFNKSQQRNAVEVASQNRSFSGGSVQAVMAGNKADMQNDIAFAEAIGAYQERQYKAQAENLYKGALSQIKSAKEIAVMGVGSSIFGAVTSIVG